MRAGFNYGISQQWLMECIKSLIMGSILKNTQRSLTQKSSQQSTIRSHRRDNAALF